MSRWTVITGTLVVLIVAAVAPAAATGTAARPTYMAPFDPQGEFEVEALVGGLWQQVGDLRYDRFIRERALVLPDGALAEPRVRIRIVQHGGGAAQIDRVLLGRTPPSGVLGASEADAVALAAAHDDDVLDASGKTIELVFPPRTRGTTLVLAARIEPVVNEGDPFAFPRADQSRPLTPDSAFYTYRPTTAGSKPPWPSGLDPSKALFAEFCRPTTGHPDGTTYGWVTNDRDTLYAEVEFTPDNTCDGDKDFSTLTVERDGTLKEFKVSEDQTRWGFPSFLSTPRASYHHKLYTFAIPFAELGVTDAREAGELKLAFHAYGTAASFSLIPSTHDFGPVAVGSSSSALTVLAVNNTSGSITLGTPFYQHGGPNSDQFIVSSITCHDGTVLTAGATCQFSVVFSPTFLGSATDAISVRSNVGTFVLHVQGTGANPIPTFSRTGLTVLVLAFCALGYFVLRRR
jgi:hypothetical protein